MRTFQRKHGLKSHSMAQGRQSGLSKIAAEGHLFIGIGIKERKPNRNAGMLPRRLHPLRDAAMMTASAATMLTETVGSVSTPSACARRHIACLDWATDAVAADIDV